MADMVVAITDNLVDHPICPVSIPQYQVDYIVKVDSIGDPKGISTGALRMTSNPRDLLMARLAAKVIEHAGYFKTGFGMQLGAGAASVATGKFLRESMLRDKVIANFAIGGILGPFCDLLDEGLIKTLFDTQVLTPGPSSPYEITPDIRNMTAHSILTPGTRARWSISWIT